MNLVINKKIKINVSNLFIVIPIKAIKNQIILLNLIILSV